MDIAPKDWVLAFSSGLAGAFLSSTIMWITFYDNLESVKKVEQTRLITDLRREFYNPTSTYSEIHKRMLKLENGECLLLYDKWKNKNGISGTFNHAEIIEYLGFFENLGYFSKENIVDIGLINEFFGSAISEAYHRDELKRFIEKIQKKDKNAFKNFQYLANKDELKNSPHYKYFENKPCWKTLP